MIQNSDHFSEPLNFSIGPIHQSPSVVLGNDINRDRNSLGYYNHIEQGNDNHTHEAIGSVKVNSLSSIKRMSQSQISNVNQKKNYSGRIFFDLHFQNSFTNDLVIMAFQNFYTFQFKIFRKKFNPTNNSYANNTNSFNYNNDNSKSPKNHIENDKEREKERINQNEWIPLINYGTTNYKLNNYINNNNNSIRNSNKYIFNLMADNDPNNDHNALLFHKIILNQNNELMGHKTLRIVLIQPSIQCREFSIKNLNFFYLGKAKVDSLSSSKGKGNSLRAFKQEEQNPEISEAHTHTHHQHGQEQDYNMKMNNYHLSKEVHLNNKQSHQEGNKTSNPSTLNENMHTNKIVPNKLDKMDDLFHMIDSSSPNHNLLNAQSATQLLDLLISQYENNGLT